MNSVLVSHFVVFALGLASGYLLLLVQDRRQSSRTLSREVYQPTHRLIILGIQRVDMSARFEDYSQWEEICSSGLVYRISVPTLLALSNTFKTLRDYDRAGSEFDKRMHDIRKQWDSFGGPAAPGCDIRHINWWLLVSNSEFEWTDPELGSRGITSLGQQYLDGDHLRALGQTLKEFAHARWSEMQNDPYRVHFCHMRRKTLAQLRQALELLSSLIRV